MTQEDYSVANASGATVRADINSQLEAIATMNSGATEPSTKFADMGWFDTANNLMKVRNEANAAWITIAEKTSTEWKPYHGTVEMSTIFAKLASPALTGNPTAPTQAAGNNSTRLASTAFVHGEIANIVAKTADETVNNSTAFQNDDHLLFAMAANKSYAVRVALLIQPASGTPDYKFDWSVPSGCTMLWGKDVTWQGSATALLTESSELALNVDTNLSGMQMRAIVRNGANAGNLQLRWAQITQNASDSKILKHSFLTYQLIGAT